MSDALPDLDETFHVKARLGIMTVLLSSEPADFQLLKARLGLTDGNLGAHLRVLEGTGYISVKKTFQGRKPRSVVRTTSRGRDAFRKYLVQLETVIKMASDDA